jgi:transaldolase
MDKFEVMINEMIDEAKENMVREIEDHLFFGEEKANKMKKDRFHEKAKREAVRQFDKDIEELIKDE